MSDKPTTDERCRFGHPILDDNYCKQGHMKPPPKPTAYDEHVSSVEEALPDLPDNPTTPCFAEATQDKGEWTVEWIAMLANKGREDEILAAHNAALAAERRGK
jgi:hypothetical protein